MYMGTITTKETDSTQMIAFGNWFSWCQSCRHGGHAEHVSKWFLYVYNLYVIIFSF